MSSILPFPGTGRWIGRDDYPAAANFTFLKDLDLQHVLNLLSCIGLYDVRCVGGCVRDALLGISPNDIDVATPEHPDSVMDRMAKNGVKSFATGLQHGTVTLVYQHIQLEVTTLRQDIQTNGRHAVIAFTENWDLDAARRDFTINALSCRPNGAIYDPFNGLDDLKTGSVRFIGCSDDRLQEDYLRLLRFFRFSARFCQHHPFDPEGLAACQRQAKGLKHLSAERIQAEMLKLLALPKLDKALQYLTDGSVWPYLFTDRPMPDQLTHLSQLLLWQQTAMTKDPILRLACLLPSQQIAQQTALLWKLSHNDTIKLTTFFDASLQDKLNRLIREWHMPPHTINYQKLLNVCCFNNNRETLLRQAIWTLSRDYSPALQTDWQVFLEMLENHPHPIFPLNGKHLIAIGVPPGPVIGQILQQVQKWWLTTLPLADVDACLLMAQQLNNDIKRG